MIMHRPRKLCLKCLRPLKACFCKYLMSFNTRTKFCFLMHPLEAKRSQIGTGRLAHLALDNSLLIIDKDFDSNKIFNDILNDDHYEHFLLYPTKTPVKLEATAKSASQMCIFILDGTWPCAKSMMRDTTKLHNLPKIMFQAPNRSQFEIKQQPANYCLSTIESTKAILANLNELNIEDLHQTKLNSLDIAFKKMVKFHKDLASDPTSNNYERLSSRPKPQSLKTPALKWKKRKIFFDQ